MIRGLVKIANKLDSMGLVKEADILDSIIRKIANDPEFNPDDQDDGTSSEEDYDDNSTEFDLDFENSPEGIGKTEPRYFDGKKTPEERLIMLMKLAEYLDGMEDDEFKRLIMSLDEERKRTIVALLGENSITPSYRVKNYSYEER